MAMQSNRQPGGSYANTQPGAWWNNPWGGGLTGYNDTGVRGGGGSSPNPGTRKAAPAAGGGRRQPIMMPGAEQTARMYQQQYQPQAQQQQPQAAPQTANLSQYLSQVPPIMLPTAESQNQLMALGAQNASVNPLLERMVGNNGIQAGSGVNAMRMANPMQAAMRNASQGAAQLGLEDQLARDKHLLTGMVGLGGADFGRQRANLGYQQIGMDAQNNYVNALLSLLGGMGGAFGGL